MVEFLSTLDTEAIIAGYAALLSTGLLVLALLRWRREKSSVYASLVVDAPPAHYAHWDPELLELTLWNSKQRNDSGKLRRDLLPTFEVGLTNIGSGAARGVEVRFLFQCHDLKERIEHSGVFRYIANVVTDEMVTLTSERVVPDTGDLPCTAIDRRYERIQYNVEDSDSVRILEPTTSDVHMWQAKVQIPRPISNAILLYCVSSFAEITRREVGSVGERKESSRSASVRDPGAPPPPDNWMYYSHDLPSLIVELRYSDDFNNRYQKSFEMPGTFICMPNLLIREGRRPPQSTVEFEFSRPREIQL